MANAMTACFVGLGSIGKRHLRNLVSICAERGITLSADALRHAPTPLEPEVASLLRTQYFDCKDLPHYDLLFLCNPSQSHYETLLQLKDVADHVFVEKPVFTKALTESQQAAFGEMEKYYVACPLRHTKVYAALKSFVAENPVYSVRAICSSYLPEWRPGQDYRTLYSALKESGGVKLDLIHEFDYLFSLFGFPQRAMLVGGHYSNLEMESDDVVSYVAAYPDKTLELHLDYIGRKVQRYVEVYSRDKTVRFDYANAAVVDLATNETLSLAEERNASCRREIEYFVDLSFRGGENINPLPFACEVLQGVCD